MKKILYFLSLLLIFSCTNEKVYRLTSPDKSISLQLFVKDSALNFSQMYLDDTIISNSPLGLIVNSFDYSKGTELLDFKETSFNDTWETVNGKNRTVQNNYNEYIFNLKQARENSLSYDLVFRCYNDGFAYRYVIMGANNDSILLEKEQTSLRFKNDFVYWAYNGEHHNIGPLKRSESQNNEVRIPMVLELQDSLFMVIHEAEIINYAPLSLNTEGKGYSVGFNVEKTVDKGSLKTSWRTFIVGTRPGDLVESDLIVNLNEPCKIEDVSWIKPGKSLWDWRVWGYKTKDGFEYGLNTLSHKRFIDFASENNIQFLLIDADWYGPEFNSDSDPTQARQGIDIEECMAYAKERGVGVILYLNDVGAKKFGLERVLKQFSEWGAVGVKYGFMKNSGADKVRYTRKVVELCAKYHLMVNFHDNPVPPSGDRRTWPNLITKEFGHSQSDAKRSYYPETIVTAPFVNMVAGPLDLCNGWFSLNDAYGNGRYRVFEEIPGTVAAEVAKLIVVYTGLMVLPDSPEEYLKKDDLFDCIRKMPAQFDSFKVLDGDIGEFICVARKAGEDWFIGALTNRESRSIEISLDFLPQGQKYEATIYSDSKETHYMDNKESYEVKNTDIQAGDKIELYMAPGGGGAIYLHKKGV